MPLSKSLIRIALEELQSDRCHAPHPKITGEICSNRKSPMQSFCPRCYFKLPRKTRTALYTHLNDGYAEIYNEAKELLKGL